jgi:hypothetical protein
LYRRFRKRRVVLAENVRLARASPEAALRRLKERERVCREVLEERAVQRFRPVVSVSALCERSRDSRRLVAEDRKMLRAGERRSVSWQPLRLREMS